MCSVFFNDRPVQQLYWFTTKNSTLPMSSVSIVLQASFWTFLWLNQPLRGLWCQGFEPGKNRCHAMVIAWSSLSKMQRTMLFIIEAPDDIVFKKGNLDVLVHWNTLLEMQAVFQIIFLEDMLIVTNALSLLQFNVKDFAAVSCIVSSMLQILEVIDNDFDSIHLKSFNKSAEIIEKIESYIKWNIFLSGTHTKRSRQAYIDTHKEFHKEVINHLLLHWQKKWKVCLTWQTYQI